MNGQRGGIRGMVLAAVFLLVAVASFVAVPVAGQNVSGVTVWSMILLFVVLTFVGVFLRSPLPVGC